MYADFHDLITTTAALLIDPTLPAFEETFAPVIPADPPIWQEILMSVLNLVGTVGIATYFNGSMFLDNPNYLCLCLTLYSCQRLTPD